MDLKRLEQALQELPIDALLTEIPQVQNSIKHLLASNDAMREYDPNSTDPDLTVAITENQAVLERHEKRIDLTLEVIRKRIGEAAAREVGSNIVAFRKTHSTTTNKTNEGEGEGVYL